MQIHFPSRRSSCKDCFWNHFRSCLFGNAPEWRHAFCPSVPRAAIEPQWSGRVAHTPRRRREKQEWLGRLSTGTLPQTPHRFLLLRSPQRRTCSERSPTRKTKHRPNPHSVSRPSETFEQLRRKRWVAARRGWRFNSSAAVGWLLA